MRNAPSSLMTSPLIIEFSIILCTKWPYSEGSPRRFGKGAVFPSSFLTFSGNFNSNGVRKRPVRRSHRNKHFSMQFLNNLYVRIKSESHFLTTSFNRILTEIPFKWPFSILSNFQYFPVKLLALDTLSRLTF